jgi:hypothetical protein
MKDYCVYRIRVDGIIRYVGKGKGSRMYSHMKEVNRDQIDPSGWSLDTSFAVRIPRSSPVI